MASSSSNGTSGKYDVFLNFRGTDTRNNFTSHLHHALCNKGIHTFIDDQLERGNVISSALLETIESSRISILVFSQDYASSTYCLDELVKILECQESKGHIVLPIFYNVSPEEVEMQTGKYAEAFTRHESMEGLEKVKVWKAALSTATAFAGWHLNNRNEANFIKDIVERVHHKLNKKSLHVADCPVGIDYHVKILSRMLSDGSNDVCMVGIYGTGGIGKTTIAKATFNIFANQFEGSCFLANVRETSKRYDGVAQLQETLLFEILGDKEVLSRNDDRGIMLLKDRLCSKKVFIVIDDVDDVVQLKKLAGEINWFSSGSRIIITTRDERLLASHGVQTIHKVEGLCHEDAIRLFSWNAFKKYQPEERFAELSLRVLKYANGLPLALIVLGSHLYDRDIDEWEDCLELWKQNPPQEIFGILKISFDALGDNEKAIFLDIACFFKLMNLDYVTKILKACDFKPAIGIQILIEKSLISIEYGTLQMHDLIQSMGWQIVRQESPDIPGERSRLWFHEDVHHVLTEEMGTHKIQAIMVDLPKEEEEIHLPIQAFSRMKKLRILIIRNAHITGDLTSLPNELRWLDWPQCPLETLPSTFGAKKLVALNMPNSLIKHIGGCYQNFRNLKYMNFRDCKFLMEIPDLSTAKNLQTMDFQGCTSLVRIHPSLGSLEKLETLSFRFCTKLEELPNAMEDMACLQELDLAWTAIRELPSSIEFLSKLERLNLRSCKNLTSLPSSIYKLNSLQKLYLSHCSQLSKFPKNTTNTTPWLYWNCVFGIKCCNLSDLEFLKSFNFSLLSVLDLSGNSFASIPSCISKFTYLQKILLRECPRLREIPELPRSTEKVVASDCKSLERSSQLTHIFQFSDKEERLCEVTYLDFSNCHKLADNQGIDFPNVVSYFNNRSSLKPFNVVLPGGEILLWFHYKSDGDSLSFQLPSSVSRKIKAVLFCIIITSGGRAEGVNYKFFIDGIRVNPFEHFDLEPKSEFESDHMLFGKFPHGLYDFYLSGASVKIQYAAANGTVKKCGAYLVFEEDNAHSVCNDEPGSKKNEFGMSLALSLRPSVLISQDPLGIQELKDRRHDSCEAIENSQRKRIKVTNKYVFELSLALPLQPNAQDPSRIEELEDANDGDCESNGYRGRKSFERTYENMFDASVALPLLSNVPVTLDLLEIEELGATQSEDSELHGQPQRKRMGMTDEHAMTFSDNEHEFQLPLALSLQTTILGTRDTGGSEEMDSAS